MLITYNDDQQGYPHPDHLRVHEISVRGLRPGRRPRAGIPELGEPWQPLKLYYSVWSRERMLAVHEALLRLRGSSPYDDKWFARPSQDERITTRIDVHGFLRARTESLLAHATQIDPNEAVLVRPDRRGDDARCTRARTGCWRSRSSATRPRASGRTTCSPGCGERVGVSGADHPVPHRAAASATRWCSGPDDADVVVTVGQADVGLDPTVAYMQGKLKAAGHTGVLLEALRSGEVARALARASASGRVAPGSRSGWRPARSSMRRSDGSWVTSA